MRELLETIRMDFIDKLAVEPKLSHREVQFAPLSKRIKVAIGMRRVGKTSLMLQEVQHLMEQGIPYTQILYLDLEDDRLLPMSKDDFGRMVDEFYTLFPENHQKKCYLFFDEIQNVDEWPLVIRRLQNTKQVDIYLSGSSAKMLSKEIATTLRGRSFATEVWPFSFTEYCHAHQKPFSLSKDKKNRDFLRKYLETYLHWGGFPELLSQPEEFHTSLLQEYVDIVIFRDIVERHAIKNISLVKYLIRFLLKNPGALFSINKFANDAKSQGYKVGRDALADYIEYIEDAYLAFFVPLYSESLKKMQVNPKKIYVIDTGLANAYSLSFSKNLGHCFENLVYIDLRRKNYEVHYHLTEERYEVDFYTQSPTGERYLYQVVWDIQNTETMYREQRALEIAKKELKVEGTIVTPQNYFDLFC